MMQTNANLCELADAQRRQDRTNAAKAAAKQSRDARRDGRGDQGRRERARTSVPRDSVVWRTCGSKTRYATQRQALSAIRNLVTSTQHRLTAYQCPYCGGWHMTHRHAEAPAGEQATVTRGAGRMTA